MYSKYVLFIGEPYSNSLRSFEMKLGKIETPQTVSDTSKHSPSKDAALYAEQKCKSDLQRFTTKVKTVLSQVKCDFWAKAI